MEGYTKNSEIPEGIFYINLDQLFEKRVSQRESALSFNIRAFTENRQNHGFIEQNLITLLYRCLDSMTKGSAKEISLAAHTIGLVAVAVAHRAREVYVESLPVLSAALKSGSVSSKILECLVLVTFFGAENCEDTQSAMQMIWEFIHKKSASTLLATAISAWTFLLASMDGWKLSYKHWQGATSYLSNLLKEEDEAVRLAAGEALALILETGFLEKFSGHCSSIKSDEIINNVNKFILKFRAEYHESQDSSKQLDFICDVLKFFEDDYYPQVSVNIGGHILTLSTYSQLIQFVNQIFDWLNRETNFSRVSSTSHRKNISIMKKSGTRPLSCISYPKQEPREPDSGEALVMVMNEEVEQEKKIVLGLQDGTKRHRFRPSGLTPKTQRLSPPPLTSPPSRLGFGVMEGKKSRGYAWAISAGVNAALAAISAKLFSSQVIFSYSSLHPWI
ncbi:hypothetical protein VitviT2T_027826 [Vitis vinifera]|uniref:Interferon-related developmental regulator N-terminal domain-containing protein n=1 Tax=Vitis vinifera TaxID=29760 RepID=A0ABY9DUH2_VITVI|nr:hypothetical protein VitviT2T_027826 [Vitis vinifera]